MHNLYIGLFISLSLIALSVRGKKTNKIIFLLLLLILVLLATFRPDTMRDYMEYAAFFSADEENLKFEFGFQWFVHSLNTITYEPLFFFFIFALFSVGFRLFFLYKYAPFFWVSVVVYLSNVFILHDMIQLRAAIASVALLWSTIYIYQKKFKHFILIVILASLFHYSAIGIIPFYFLSSKNVCSKWVYFIIPLSYAMYILGVRLGGLVQYIPVDFVQNLYGLYTKSAIYKEESVNVFNALQLFRCLIFYVILYYSKTIFNHAQYIYLYLKIYALGLSALVLLSDIPTFAFRIGELYQSIEIVLIPLLVYAFKSKSIGKGIVLFIASLIVSINIFYIKLLD